MPGTLVVHIRVNDSRTDRPTPVRLRIAGPQGEFFAPLGRQADFPLGRNEAVGGHLYLQGKKYVYIDGACEISLPTEVPLEIEISKGPRYQTIRQTVTLGPGQMSLRFTIESLGPSEHISADSRCHFLPPHTALLEAACEDIDLVHLLAVEQDFRSEDGHRYRTTPNLTDFSGQEMLLSREGRSLAVNTFNSHPALGSLALINCHRPVFPLKSGDDEGDDWSLLDWCDQCHRKNGLAVWCDAYRPEAGLPGGAALVAAVLGKVDALEFDGRERSRPLVPAWYRLLNAGFRLPIVGGSGKDSNRVALGSMRTYISASACAGLESPPGMRAWSEAVRQGRCFISNGPLLELRIDDEQPGAVVELQSGKLPSIEAAIDPSSTGLTVEIVVNGHVVAVNGEPTRAELTRVLAGGGWIAARCHGAASALDQNPPSQRFAHTAPIYVTVPGQPPRVDPAARKLLRIEVDQVRDWIETTGWFRQENSKARLLKSCDEAMRVLGQGLIGYAELRC